MSQHWTTVLKQISPKILPLPVDVQVEIMLHLKIIYEQYIYIKKEKEKKEKELDNCPKVNHRFLTDKFILKKK